MHTAFDITYLEYNDAIQFRGFASSKAIEWAGKQTLFKHNTYTRLDLRYNDAYMLFLVMQAMEAMAAGSDDHEGPLPPAVDLQDTVKAAFVHQYDAWVHTHAFGPASPQKVLELVGDGHEKVLSRLCAASQASR